MATGQSGIKERKDRVLTLKADVPDRGRIVPFLSIWGFFE